jgi:asparagine N-glycosylation enzyme membrane subunit Stt3
LGVSALAAIASGSSQIASLGLQTVRDALRGGSAVQELYGLSPRDLLSYGVLLLAIVLGLFIAFKRGRREDWFILGWFVILLALGLFASRLFMYAAPAAWVLSGIGLADFLEPLGIKFSWAAVQMSRSDAELRLRYVAVAAGVVIILASLALSLENGYRFVSQPLVVASNDWEEAMSYLREHTPPDAVVLTDWAYGYWIRDMAQRNPVVDNGYWTENANEDIALVYTATDISEAVRIMEKYGADYAVFSRLDYVLLPDITKDAFGESYGDGNSIPMEMSDSLYARSISGKFLYGEGLRRVYPDASIERPEVVILTLE